MSHIHCNGHEQTLFECDNYFGEHYSVWWYPYYDANVYCYNKGKPCPEPNFIYMYMYS